MTTTVEATKAQLLERAEALVPSISARAAETEEARHVPQETLDELIEAGFLRITTPRGRGGLDLDVDTAWEVGAILGRGCGSTAWCYMVATIHNWIMGLAPDQAQEEYFTTPDQLASAAFGPPVKAQRTDGGWLIAGRWPFASGVDHARWALVGAILPDAGYALLPIPRSEYRTEDDWCVSGLRGTGSKSVVLDEPTFVPFHRHVRLTGSPNPEARAAHDRHSYGAPFFAVASFVLVAPLVGMAQGMLDAFAERMHTRRTPAGQQQSELPAQQLRLAEAAAEIDAALALARADLSELRERGDRGDEFSDLDRARYRRDQGFTAKLCVNAANRLFDGGGGTAIYETNPLQRFHRDIHAGSHQVALTWDSVGELYGRARFGLELARGNW